MWSDVRQALAGNEAASRDQGIGCLAAAASIALLVVGCTHERLGPVSQHYLDFHTQAPRNNTVYVCHAYGCRLQTPFRFNDADIAALRTLMTKPARPTAPSRNGRPWPMRSVGWKSAPAM